MPNTNVTTQLLQRRYTWPTEVLQAVVVSNTPVQLPTSDTSPESISANVQPPQASTDSSNDNKRIPLGNTQTVDLLLLNKDRQTISCDCSTRQSKCTCFSPQGWNKKSQKESSVFNSALDSKLLQSQNEERICSVQAHPRKLDRESASDEYPSTKGDVNVMKKLSGKFLTTCSTN